MLKLLMIFSLIGPGLCILVGDNDHHDILVLKQDMQLMKSELAELKELKTKVQVLETVMAKPSVAFMAELSKNIDNPAPGRQIVFDVVHLNRGNAYNNSHGTFIAPVNGTYHFSLELSFPSTNVFKQTHVMLMKKSQNIAYIYCDGTQDYWIKRSATVLVDLQTGDDVYPIVQFIKGDQHIAGCCMHSTFSGFLVNQI